MMTASGADLGASHFSPPTWPSSLTLSVRWSRAPRSCSRGRRSGLGFPRVLTGQGESISFLLAPVRTRSLSACARTATADRGLDFFGTERRWAAHDWVEYLSALHPVLHGCRYARPAQRPAVHTDRASCMPRPAVFAHVPLRPVICHDAEPLDMSLSSDLRSRLLLFLFFFSPLLPERRFET